MNIPSVSEYKAQLEEGHKQFTEYYTVLFAVMALVFIVKALVS